MFRLFQLKFSKDDSFEITQYFGVTYHSTFSHQFEFKNKKKKGKKPLEILVFQHLPSDRASFPWDASATILPYLLFMNQKLDGWLQGPLHRTSLRLCCTWD